MRGPSGPRPGGLGWAGASGERAGAWHDKAFHMGTACSGEEKQLESSCCSSGYVFVPRGVCCAYPWAQKHQAGGCLGCTGAGLSDGTRSALGIWRCRMQPCSDLAPAQHLSILLPSTATWPASQHLHTVAQGIGTQKPFPHPCLPSGTAAVGRRHPRVHPHPCDPLWVRGSAGHIFPGLPSPIYLPRPPRPHIPPQTPQPPSAWAAVVARRCCRLAVCTGTSCPCAAPRNQRRLVWLLGPLCTDCPALFPRGII